MYLQKKDETFLRDSAGLIIGMSRAPGKEVGSKVWKGMKWQPEAKGTNLGRKGESSRTRWKGVDRGEKGDSI